MRVIPPITITAGILTSSSIAEPYAGETTWAAGAYTAGDIRIRTSNHKKYQCLVTGTHTSVPESDPTNWFELGPTNKWAMFDTLRNSATTDTSSIVVTLTPATRVNSLALLQLNATTVTISVSSTIGGGVVYTKTLNLHKRKTVRWYEYFFTDIETRPSAIVFDIPEYTDPVITVTIAGGPSVSCGALIIGMNINLGYTQPGINCSALNFSTVDRDIYGNATMVQRRTVPKNSLKVYTPVGNLDILRQVRDDLNAIPAVWSGLDDQDTHDYFEALLILGFYRTFSINAENQEYASIDLELEEI